MKIFVFVQFSVDFEGRTYIVRIEHPLYQSEIRIKVDWHGKSPNEASQETRVTFWEKGKNNLNKCKMQE